MFFKMFLRSFFMQAGWNYERFQNLGFAFCLQPALEKIYQDKDALKAALLRHLQIFNTQPYMASFVLGNMASLEEKAAASPDPEARLKTMLGVKLALASSFASIGDRIFWGRLKPMTAQICLLVWAAGGFYGWLFTGLNTPVSIALLLAGPLAGIVFYSSFAVYWRWHGLRSGYACGGEASCGLDRSDWSLLIRRLSTAGFLMSLAVALLAFGMLAFLNCGSCRTGDFLLKMGLPLAVLALHRVTRFFGRSVFFAAGLVLAVSILLFSVLGLQPFKLYL
ncbi:MAG: PTS system mannose/fructose/sorbose family transporter subunit IID [Elusimicrobiota bacterium]|nr:PTS system mannose/fructose/sorbose family transporter subunit IID [Elusimicrobiota bacterium]